MIENLRYYSNKVINEFCSVESVGQCGRYCPSRRKSSIIKYYSENYASREPGKIHTQYLVQASHLKEVGVMRPVLLQPPVTISIHMSESDMEEYGTAKEEPENYSNDPYTIINQFFLDGDILDAREDLNKLFEAAFSDELIAKQHYPSLLVFAFSRIDRLIDAAYTLYWKSKGHQGEVEKNPDYDVLEQTGDIYKKLKDWNLFPYRLKPFEWVNPRLAIRAFFEHQPLSHWKGKLHEILQAGIRNESICSTVSDRSKLYLDCEHLYRLVEAMWIILVMEIRAI